VAADLGAGGPGGLGERATPARLRGWLRVAHSLGGGAVQGGALWVHGDPRD